MNYRPDIDGLRAISVTAVVGYHAFPGLLRGGFIGVDVFFVISGFLITGLILEGLQNGSFSLVDFYYRRICRIFPALGLVLLVILILGAMILLDDEYEQLGWHSLGGVVFVVNFLLLAEVGYFDIDSTTKPLLHLWSLAIEEQFYILWPLALMLVWRLGRGLLALFLGVVTVSLLLNLGLAGTAPNFVFYMPVTRFWELATGGVLAWYVSGGGRELAPRLADLSSLLGLAVILCAAAGLHDQLHYPGKWALLPVGGTLLLIASGPESLVNRAVLGGFRPLVWVGLISYPLYLWHWPLLSYLRVLEGKDAPVSYKLVLVAVSVALAWLTYRLIERPVRQRGHRATKAWALVLVMGAVGALGIAVPIADGLPGRASVTLNAVLSSGKDGGAAGNAVVGCGTSKGDAEDRFHACRRDRRGNTRYALIGDSKAEAIYPGLIRTSGPAGHWLVLGGWSPKTGAPVPLLFPGKPRPISVVIDEIGANPDVEVVVLVTAVRALFGINAHNKPGTKSNYDHRYLSRIRDRTSYERQFEGLSNTVKAFLDRGKQVVFVIDNPALPHLRDCAPRKTGWSAFDAALSGNVPEACFVSLKEFLRDTAIYRDLIAALQTRFPVGLHVFDPTSIYCSSDTQICGPTKNGRALYSYTDHVSDYASGQVGAKLHRFLAEIAPE